MSHPFGSELEKVCRFLGEDGSLVDELIHDLIASRLADRIGAATKDVAQFEKADIQTIDSLRLFRSFLYLIVRLTKPALFLETGVLHGFGSSFILQAMEHNKCGRLVSIDLPHLDGRYASQGNSTIPPGKQPGWAIPDELRARHDLRFGPAERLLPAYFASESPPEIFMHDSDHSYEHMAFEMSYAWKFLRPGSLMIVDNIEANDSYADFIKVLDAKALWLRLFQRITLSFGFMDCPSDKNAPLGSKGLVVVTGASGLIGRAVHIELARSGYQVEDAGRNLKCSIAIDLSSSIRLDRALTRRPTAVVHCAAGVPNRGEDTKSLAARTIAIDRNVADAVRFWQCKAIYLSACTFYDPRAEHYKTEAEAVDSFGSPYLEAKLLGERLFQSIEKATVLRVSAPIGPGANESYLFGGFFHKAMRGESLDIWGRGLREQDYVDTRDVAIAIKRALDGGSGRVFNVASGKPTTTAELARTICEVVGKGCIVQKSQADPDEGRIARFDISKIADELGWRPSYTLIQTIKWVAAQAKFAPRRSV